MKSKFHERAIAQINAEERALMIKSLEIISQIHSILDRRGITQKMLAEMLNISAPAVSKMLMPGGNLELGTINRLELILGEVIISTPQKASLKDKEPIAEKGQPWREATYEPGERKMMVSLSVN